MQYDFSLPRFDNFYIYGIAPFYLQELLLVFRAIEAALIGMSDSNVIDTSSGSGTPPSKWQEAWSGLKMFFGALASILHLQ